MEQKETGQPQVRVGVAADKPELREMLVLSQFGISAYFNSFMADVHYRRLLLNLSAGKTWFLPELLKHALAITRLNSKTKIQQDILSILTDRERDIVMVVGQSMSNEKIADDFGVSEGTFKTYLSRVFKKLNIKDWNALTILLRRMH